MAIVNDRLNRLTNAITAAGIPIDGISQASDGTLTVQYRAEATQAQRDQAAAMVASFDMRPRRPRSYADLIAAFQALTAAQQTQVRNRVLLWTIRQNPEIIEDLNLPIAGDEPEA